MQEITLPFPDDWHCHLRDIPYLTRTVDDTSQRFHRVIVMPNLNPPIVNVTEAITYQNRILQHLPNDRYFKPLMTLYLTASLRPEEIEKAKQSQVVFACKLYPAHATTHSDAGITDIKSIYPILEAMQQQDLPLLIHGEVVDDKVNIIDREKIFIEKELTPIIRNFPQLRVVLEHISTKIAVEYITDAPKNVAATITPHHLFLNLNHLLADGIRPHYYCKPIVKQLEDQTALLQAATSGNAKFFLGTDSAPHSKKNKECAVGCAGVYSAHAGIELYAEIFEQQDKLAKLADFAGRFGAQFYGLPINPKTLTLIRKPWQIPEMLKFGDYELVPFFAGQTLNWQIKK